MSNKSKLTDIKNLHPNKIKIVTQKYSYLLHWIRDGQKNLAT